jgi:hypothetical protein
LSSRLKIVFMVSKGVTLAFRKTMPPGTASVTRVPEIASRANERL